MTKKKSKSTRKFERNRLKDTVDRRKDFAKIKQRHQKNDKKKKRIDTGKEPGNTSGRGQDEAGDSDEDEVDNMNNDQFFQHELEILDQPKKGKNGATKVVSSSVGKRKRSDEDMDTSSAGEDEDGFAGFSAESGSDQESEVSAGHKGQLNALAENDPDFYRYLQENDAELLDFDETGDLAEIDALSDSEEERPAKRAKKDSKQKNGTDTAVPGGQVVTDAMVQKWKASMTDQNSVRALRQLVLAFRAAAHINDDENRDSKYTIPDPDVYHKVIVTALKHVPSVLNHHLPVKETSSGKLRISTDSAKFKTMTPLIKSYASSVHYLLSHLSDSSTLKMTLQCFEHLLPYVLQFRKFLKVILKTVVIIWSDSTAAEASRISAFIILRRLMVLGDAGIHEAILKAVYEGIVKGSRNTTTHTISGVNLMKNSAAEIWGIDPQVGYTTGYTSIRQLAIHLRGTITKPTKDSYKTIYNWQFVHSLDFFSRVLSNHCNSLQEAQTGTGKPSLLRPLIYPLVQITLGALRLIPTATYFPLRFQLTRSLLRLSSATDTYIPLAPCLLEVLQSADMRKPAKPSTLKPLDWTISLRCPASYLKTRVYQDQTGDQVLELFGSFFAIWTKSIAFPELILPVSVMLKRWLRAASSKSNGNRNGKVNGGVTLLCQKLDSNARWIKERRDQVAFSPRDREQVRAFLKDVAWEETPLGAFVKAQRKIGEEREKVLQKSREEEQKQKKKAGDENGAMDEDLE